MNISDTIKGLRLNKKMTLKQLSENSGLTVSYLSRIESGERSPTIKSLESICASFNISINTLFILADSDKSDLSMSLKRLVKNYL